MCEFNHFNYILLSLFDFLNLLMITFELFTPFNTFLLQF